MSSITQTKQNDIDKKIEYEYDELKEIELVDKAFEEAAVEY